MLKVDDLAKRTLDELLRMSSGYQAIEKDTEADRRLVNAVICDKLIDMGFQIGQAYVDAEGVGATLQTRKNPDKIDRQALLIAGVDAEVVDRCTTFGTDSEPFVVIRLPKAPASSPAPR